MADVEVGGWEISRAKRRMFRIAIPSGDEPASYHPEWLWGGGGEPKMPIISEPSIKPQFFPFQGYLWWWRNSSKEIVSLTAWICKCRRLNPPISAGFPGGCPDANLHQPSWFCSICCCLLLKVIPHLHFNELRLMHQKKGEKHIEFGLVWKQNFGISTEFWWGRALGGCF